jgi:hypothetical protein
LLTVLIICTWTLPACQSVQIPLTATATTAPPTNIPTPTNTSVPPTETLVPNAPAGYTRFEKGVYYKDKTENGKSVTYKWNAELNGWFTSHILESPDNISGGIPLVDQNVNGNLGIPMYINVQEDLPLIPYLRHFANFDGWGKSLSGAIFWGLYHKRFENMSRVEMGDVYRSTGLSVAFTTPDGKTYTWMPTADVVKGDPVGYKFFAVSWEDANPEVHPEFVETHENKLFGNAKYRFRTFVDADGFAVTIGAVEDPTALTDQEFLEWILNPLGVIIEHDVLPTREEFSKGWNLSNAPSDYVQRALATSYFEIIQNP